MSTLPESQTNEYEIPGEDYKTFFTECRLASEVLELAQIKHTKGAVMFISKTIAGKYKEVSEFADINNRPKPERRKKSMKELMQQSVFHGASWIGYNFIA